MNTNKHEFKSNNINVHLRPFAVNVNSNKLLFMVKWNHEWTRIHTNKLGGFAPIGLWPVGPTPGRNSGMME